MNNSLKNKINTAGLIGYIISILLIIATITMTVVSILGAGVSVFIPKDSIEVNVSTVIGIKASDEAFELLKTIVDTDSLTDEEGNILNLDEENIGVALDDDDIQEISIAQEGDSVIVDAQTNSIKLNKGKLMASLISSALFFLSLTIMLYMVKALMKALKVCDTPFSDDIIMKMKRFAYSMIPAIVMSSVAQALWSAFASGGSDIEMSLNLGGVLIVAVVFILIMVFTYGAELQRESDETL